ncbi:MAG: biopolymer transporter ExbD [Crocinitomicaceae bacterium]|nr:biopolymer transporter ExbD [Crocinitomicaceae bacterium]
MGKFNKGKTRALPALSTASLPDIIFMLLFFFMVATTMKEVDMQVEVKKPGASEAVALENKDMVDFIYVGFPTDADEGTQPRIQLDDQLAIDYTQVAPWKLSKAREGKTVFDIVTSLKVHEDVGMRVVSNIKETLREIDAVKINYSADKR